MRSRESGFTLIEILIVLAIISTLVGGVLIVIPFVGKMQKVSTTKTLIGEIEALLKAAENPSNLAEFPPTRTGDLRLGSKKIGKEIAPQNDVNEGVETVAVVVFMDGLVLGSRIDTKHLGNTDGDFAQAQWTIHGEDKKDLFEILDAWGNPLIYVHHRDYDRGAGPYRLMAEDYGGEPMDLPAPAHKDPKTGTFYRLESYQLYSAGPDGVPGNDDDIATFLD